MVDQQIVLRLAKDTPSCLSFGFYSHPAHVSYPEEVQNEAETFKLSDLNG
ncbi:hypothetical protein LJC54_03465 [Parabacteroides sp. OttesenSCG-928-J18]|nr:hypothetical protein [Parabacteroides sp. OttesenSCG-928-J18]